MTVSFGLASLRGLRSYLPSYEVINKTEEGTDDSACSPVSMRCLFYERECCGALRLSAPVRPPASRVRSCFVCRRLVRVCYYQFAPAEEFVVCVHECFQRILMPINKQDHDYQYH